MCGIVGVLGNHEVAPIILESLKRLEYRGYDSAGIATVQDGALDRRRAVGKLVNLSDVLVHSPLPGKSGIGHTRWATHGAATEVNAHPHRSARVAVVHNGIIENFKPLREALEAKGAVFETETDTEVVTHLCEAELANGIAPEDAARKTVAQLEGAFALAFLFQGEEDLIIAARNGPPLAIGHGDGEMFIGSDALALAPMTDRITYLEDGDIAVITRQDFSITDIEGTPVSREMRQVQIDTNQAGKNGHKHYMSKEMAEQPTVFADALKHYLSPDRTGFNLGIDLDFTRFDRVVMVACGTAYLSCAVAKYWIEQWAAIPVEVDVASEYRYRQPPLNDRVLAVFVSQSGETADTLAALRHAKEGGATCLAVLNTIESTIGREADMVLPILAGVEICVASTKAFTCQLNVMALLALHAAKATGHITADAQAELLAELPRIPALMTQALALAPQMQTLSRDLAQARDILFLGRGVMYPLAQEGALKMKELSYIHAEAYASGELKHGPIALIDESVPVVVFAPQDALFEKTVSNMQEVMARGGKVVLITDAAGRKTAGDGTWHCVTLPECDAGLSAILYALPAQMLAYYTAVEKGTDVDQPRNLAKSVTVE